MSLSAIRPLTLAMGFAAVDVRIEPNALVFDHVPEGGDNQSPQRIAPASRCDVPLLGDLPDSTGLRACANAVTYW